MTIKECIDLVDVSKPNQYSLEEKVGWLSFLDGTIINDVLKTHEGYDGSYDLFEGYSTERLTAELIAPSPYDRLYPAYLKMRIDSENGEIARYNNSAALYNVCLMEYKKWYNRTHMPISGVHSGGAKNAVGGCGCEGNLDIAEKAAISAEEARQSAVRASEKVEEASVSAVRAESAKDGADRARDAASAAVSAVSTMRKEVKKDADEVRGLADVFSEAESTRVSAEALRVKAESMRVSAENERAVSEARREQAMRELIDDAARAVGCKVFDIDMASEYGFIAPDLGETKHLDFGSSIPDVRIGDFIFDTTSLYVYKCTGKAEEGAIVGDSYLCVADLGGGSGGGSGGFKKIGFTSDCDFVATAGDGYSAFAAAIEAAADGDTILVMPGVYTGTGMLRVTKDINFIGIGKPEIAFPVWIQGGGTFNFETWSWDVLYPGVTSGWRGFVFSDGLDCGCEYNPDSSGTTGLAILEDCVLSSVTGGTINGKVRNCYIDYHYELTSGHYYAYDDTGCVFENCTICVKRYFSAFGSVFKRCDIYPAYYLGGDYNQMDNTTFSGCRMYGLGPKLEFDNPRTVGDIDVGDSLIFANSVSGITGGYLVVPVAK